MNRSRSCSVRGAGCGCPGTLRMIALGSAPAVDHLSDATASSILRHELPGSTVVTDVALWCAFPTFAVPGGMLRSWAAFHLGVPAWLDQRLASSMGLRLPRLLPPKRPGRGSLARCIGRMGSTLKCGINPRIGEDRRVGLGPFSKRPQSLPPRLWAFRRVDAKVQPKDPQSPPLGLRVLRWRAPPFRSCLLGRAGWRGTHTCGIGSRLVSVTIRRHDGSSPSARKELFSTRWLD